MEFDSLDDYKAHFEPIFRTDVAFSRLFSTQINQIISQNSRKIIDIINNENRITITNEQADNAGYDRTLKLNFGVRLRRPFYKRYFDFTVDTKEWEKETQPEYYIYGYADEHIKEIIFFLLFDYIHFRKLVKQGKIKGKLKKNNKHSTVEFWAFSIKDILSKCTVIDFNGDKKTNLEDFS